MYDPNGRGAAVQQVGWNDHGAGTVAKTCVLQTAADRRHRLSLACGFETSKPTLSDTVLPIKPHLLQQSHTS